MTSPIDPRGTFRVYLDADADIALNERPYFEFRRISGREWRKLAAMSDSLSESMKAAEAIDAVFETLCIGLVGWGNQINPEDGQPVPFDPKHIDLVANPVDAQEIINKKMAGGRVSTEEKKG